MRELARRRLTGTRGAGEGGCADARADATAAATSSRPHPKIGFGIEEPGTPPQSCSDVSRTAVARSNSSVSGTRPASVGTADHSSATAPDTCGVAMEVPEKREYPFPGTEERIETPGATMSGFIRLEPSTVTGPRLLKDAMTRNLAAMANRYAESAMRAAMRQRDEYLAQATDTADLERRLRTWQAPRYASHLN